MVVPISEVAYEYALELRQTIRKGGIHVDADCSDRKMQKKVPQGAHTTRSTRTPPLPLALHALSGLLLCAASAALVSTPVNTCAMLQPSCADARDHATHFCMIMCAHCCFMLCTLLVCMHLSSSTHGPHARALYLVGSQVQLRARARACVCIICKCDVPCPEPVGVLSRKYERCTNDAPPFLFCIARTVQGIPWVSEAQPARCLLRLRLEACIHVSSSGCACTMCLASRRSERPN